jgi:glycosyltransferase involved in cell wall biosynthesis
MRIAIIASARFPISEPFAGGLEAHSWSLARGLKQRGHEVTVFAGPGSDPQLDVTLLEVSRPQLSDDARADVSMSPEWWLQEHHAYLALMLDLSTGRRDDFDIVHNNCLHYLPVAMAASLSVPVLTTLHTPPTPWLESAIQAPRGCPVTFAAVSRHTARAWRHLVPNASVVRNGVDLEKWKPGPGGGPAVWSGRLVPEKAPHLAAQAALLSGVELHLAGPIPDQGYFDELVRPLLGSQVRYLGHLDRAGLAEVVGQASVTVATPVWEEPYGLVVAESMACGTPVAGFARGALRELVGDRGGCLVPVNDVQALADAILSAQQLDRGDVRAHAARTCSLETMLDGYEQLYDDLALSAAA